MFEIILSFVKKIILIILFFTIFSLLFSFINIIEYMKFWIYHTLLSIYILFWYYLSNTTIHIIIIYFVWFFLLKIYKLIKNFF